MPFSKVQQQAINIRNKNVLVCASAGSGKTSVLVERLCRLVIDDRISIDNILAMTFTDDAANEMKSRLMKSLQEVEQDAYIRNQLALLETASICTIDSFCLSVVKNYYYKIPISLTMSNTVGDKALLDSLFNQAYKETLEELDPVEYSKLNLYFQSMGKNESDIQKSISKCIDVAWSKPDPEKWMRNQITETVPDSIYMYFCQYFKENVEAMLEILDLYIDEMGTNKDLETKKEYLLSAYHEIENNDYPSFQKHFIVYMNNTVRLKKSDTKLENTYKNIECEIMRCLFDEELYLEDYKNNADLVKVYVEIVLNTKKRFSELKLEEEIIDYSDMEHFAHKLLQNPMIAEEMKAKYEMILVDEFQDTNELQESIIHCFAREDNVFRVGDIKQSIYGFRQANPSIMLGHMQRKDPCSTTLVLDENYRSNKTVVEFNNDFYNRIMNTKLFGNAFTEKDVARLGLERQSTDKQYPVRFLYTDIQEWCDKNPGFNKTSANPLHKRNCYDMIAQDILKHIKSGFEYKDLCILTRNHTPQEAIKETLEAYGIPCLAEIDHGFYTNSAIQIIVSTLSALQNSEDDISLMASLCSPLFNVTPAQIAASCLDKGKYVSLYDQIKKESYMEEFNKVKNMVNCSIVDMVRYLYSLNDFYFFHTTSQDKTNLDSFLEKASKYKYQANLRDFVNEIQQASSLDSLSDAYPYGKEANVVKIKTMHHSKGLQFPVVYVLSKDKFKDMNASNAVVVDADLGISFGTIDKTRRFKRKSLSQIAFSSKIYHDEMKEEMRVFYVSTTRPEKELIIVDTISSMKDYSYPLSTFTLLSKNGYTGWLLNAYYDDRSMIVFDKQEELCKRPDSIKIKSFLPVIHPYQKEVEVIDNVTASAAKRRYVWDTLSLQDLAASNRGTLFHEMAGQLSYPYDKKEVEDFAQSYGYTMRPVDMDQFMSLNDCDVYKHFMESTHKFELSYISRQDNQIAHGFMDLVVYDGNHITILDFKTDTAQNTTELKVKYHLQLEMYKKSLEKMYPDASIDTCIYSFHLKSLFYL
ncbi:MAG: UvrD-helicase domain-containing protein [Holdemanella sp.]|nr:UvrD-helicase domain-containing protein [Holdemanella sp.]